MTNTREVMFVGSVPLKPAEKVFEALAKGVGSLAPRMPDGEQAGWLTLARASFAASPDFERGVEVPLEPGGLRMLTLYKPKPGVDLKTLKLGPYGYGSNALESYAQFKKLKDAGIIPAATRFQFTIPGPGTSTCVLQIPGEQLLPLARVAIWNELKEVIDRVPPGELAIQIDLGMEAEHEEYLRRPEAWDQPIHKYFHWTLEQMAESAAWVANQIPESVQLGFHICSIWHHDTRAGQDNNVLVDAANAVISHLTRPMTYIHIPVIPDHVESDYAALKRLKLPGEAKLFIGLLNLGDGLEGAKKRIAMARDAFADFGVAMFCGLGHAPEGRMGAYRDRGVPALRRASPNSLEEVLKLHRDAAAI
ncbi:MAG: hypothetical protein EXR28_05210 [Betaproteobacteria bacterium]|nr:hypothetical protein [Betaproteobacteria bacterium]